LAGVPPASQKERRFFQKARRFFQKEPRFFQKWPRLEIIASCLAKVWCRLVTVGEKKGRKFRRFDYFL
jgi:hypothetical protein